jgi:hypothetical protein
MSFSLGILPGLIPYEPYSELIQVVTSNDQQKTPHARRKAPVRFRPGGLGRSVWRTVLVYLNTAQRALKIA